MPKFIQDIHTYRSGPISWLFTSKRYPSASHFFINREEGADLSDETTTEPTKESPSPAQAVTRTQIFLATIKYFFLRAYGFDGFDQTTMMITSADGNETPYDCESLPLWVIVTSLLGFPNRPAYVLNGVPQYTVAQFFRNFVGGWNPVFKKDTAPYQELSASTKPVKTLSTEKIVWQFIAILFKAVLILPIKLLSIPFKILLNVVKLVTEFLLPFISYYIGLANVLMFLGIRALAKLAVVQEQTLVNAAPGSTSRQHTSRVSKPRAFGLAFLLIPFTAVTVAVMIVQYAMILACRMGLALTSPAKSAQQAFALGRNLLIDKNCAHDNPQTFSHFSNFVGVLGALVSLALTAVMWTIALPLALGALVTAIPAVLSAITWVAQIPFIATSLAWVSSLPIVTGSMTLLNGLFGTVGIALAAAFGPAVGALAYVISVQVPAVALAVGATLGLIVAPVAALLSLGADKLSDLWATWIESGPFTKLKSLKFGGSNTSEFRKTWHVLGTAPQTPLTEEPIETAYLYNDTSIDRKCSFVVSTEALDLVDQNKHLVGQTKLCGAMAAGCLNKAKTIDSGYRLATPQEQGAPQNTKPDPARSVGSLNPSTSDGE